GPAATTFDTAFGATSSTSTGSPSTSSDITGLFNAAFPAGFACSHAVPTTIILSSLPPIGDGSDATGGKAFRLATWKFFTSPGGRGVGEDGKNRVLSGRGSSGVAERGDDVVDHFLDQDAIVALAHHADHRLGAGRADQKA